VPLGQGLKALHHIGDRAARVALHVLGDLPGIEAQRFEGIALRSGRRRALVSASIMP
jgi:hypothetical protein